MVPAVAAGLAHLKTDASPKRASIVRAAVKLFLDRGYGDTSMDAIAAEAEVSKRTVYSYFPGKDALFEAVMIELCREQGGQLHDELPDGPPAEVLSQVGRGFLKIIMSDAALRIFRIAAAECERFPELGETFYRAGPQRSVQTLAVYLRGRHAAGDLQVPDPDLAASQFFALAKGSLFMRLVLGVGPLPSDTECEAQLRAAVTAFLKAYAVGGSNGAPASGVAKECGPS